MSSESVEKKMLNFGLGRPMDLGQFKAAILDAKSTGRSRNRVFVDIDASDESKLVVSTMKGCAGDSAWRAIPTAALKGLVYWGNQFVGGRGIVAVATIDFEEEFSALSDLIACCGCGVTISSSSRSGELVYSEGMDGHRPIKIISLRANVGAGDCTMYAGSRIVLYQDGKGRFEGATSTSHGFSFDMDFWRTDFKIGPSQDNILYTLHVDGDGMWPRNGVVNWARDFDAPGVFGAINFSHVYSEWRSSC